MSQNHDRPEAVLEAETIAPKEEKTEEASEQAEPLCLELAENMRLEIADTWANRRALMIFLRSLHDADGRPWATFEWIAEQLGYKDRRNVHNYWAEFEACGRDLGAYLRRRKKVDEEVVACCEQIWREHPLWSPSQVHAELIQRLPEKGATLSVDNIRTAGEQVGFLGVQQALRRQVAEGEAHYKEEGLIETLFEWMQSSLEEGSSEVKPIPTELETIQPMGMELPRPVPQEKVESLEEQLLEGDTSAEGISNLWQGDSGILMLLFTLYYNGLSLGTLAGFWGVHKTTLMRWLAPLSQLNWQAVVQKGQRYFSGQVAIDEKWIKIGGVWWYLFAAVDQVSGMPLHVALFPSNGKVYCRLFLLQLKQLGYNPKVIITDGWEAYRETIAQVFPQAQHLLCRFHALQAAFRRLRKALADWGQRRVWGARLARLFQTNDKRTVRRRLEKLQQLASGTPVAGVIARLAGKLPQLLPAVGSTFRPTTSNAVERFFAAFERFYRLKGPFQNKASAEKHLALFMLGYVFSVGSAEAKTENQGLCPLQKAGYQVAQIPLFHLINRPPLIRLRDRIVQSLAPAA